ncbi:MAG: HEAT repeat domain-containing protein [Thermodesulfovibrionales bacterium]
MILDYMDKGFLDNIIDLFKKHHDCFMLISDMLVDERIRVRLGVTALVETLVHSHRDVLVEIIPTIAELLSDPNPTVRGDSAYILSLIGHQSALPYLLDHRQDENPIVREIIEDTIRELSSQN